MKRIRTKTGAASFYIVTFTTLLLSVVVVGFIAVVVSEVTRTTNDDLAQSAYDSALAGVEDAKAAIKNYQTCLEQGATATMPSNTSTSVTCGEIIWYMENPECGMVGKILGRIAKDSMQEEVLVEEKSSTNSGASNNMEQAYTCVKIKDKLSDYRGNVTSASATRVVQIKLANGNVKDVKSIRLSWYSDSDGTEYKNSNFKKSSGGTGGSGNAGKVVFTSVSDNAVSVPPVLSIGLFQTSNTFDLADIERTVNGRTDRGTLYLVPAIDYKNEGNNHISTDDHVDVTSDNKISASEGFAKSNDKTSKNKPFVVNCPPYTGNEFACSVSIELPEPIGGTRSDETFMFVISLPYGQPDTDFAIEVCNDSECSEESYESHVADGTSNDKLMMSGMQVSIDSTGRANNLYRRVETRIESSNSVYYSYPEYAVQLLGEEGSSSVNLLDKTFSTTHADN